MSLRGAQHPVLLSPPATSTHAGGTRIGRVSNGLLTKIAHVVDVIEPVAKFTSVLKDNPGIGKVFTTGLEYWKPSPGILYDLVWIQWCATYIEDPSLVLFLQRCKSVLSSEKGVIVFKENLSGSDEDYREEYDGSLTR